MEAFIGRRSGQAVTRLMIGLTLASLPLACTGATGDSARVEAAPAAVPAAAPAAAPAATPAAIPAAVPDGTAPEGGTETATPAAATESGKKYYTVDCEQTDESGQQFCLTDKDTYVGWRTFHAVCHVCHGENAAGSSFAPSLLKPIDREVFIEIVTHGRTGQIGVMPAWGENPNVKNFIDELYAYQQARADGVLKPGRPKRMD